VVGLAVVPRQASPSEAEEVARLLHDFNTEFATPTPGVAVLASRLRNLLATDATYAVLTGTPSLGVALVTVRPNVWFPGPVALLDELYVVPTHRGQGLGSAILGHVLALAREAGCQLIEINVDEGDHDARRFYEHHGFSASDPDTAEQALYYYRTLAG
jgi:GNAT superfamily N-acetyltransferase